MTIQMVERIRRELPVKGKKGFQPGNRLSVGNNGAQVRQERRRLTAALLMELERPIGRKNITRKQSLAKSIVDDAIKGNVKVRNQARTLIFDRVEGAVTQALEVTGNAGGPIRQINANINMSLEEAAAAYADTLRVVEDES